MKSLITGGAGLVGSHIADLLVAGPAAHVVVLDNFSRGTRANLESAASSGHLEIIEGDIRDGGLLRNLMKDTHVVFHQAAIRITQCAEDPRLAMDVLAKGTFEVIEAAAEQKVKKVVAASSASVYGMAEAFPTGERHHPYANDTFYGAAKLFGEGMLRSLHATHGLDFVALRYFNVYGPRMDICGLYTEVLIRWMERIEAGSAPVIFGCGQQTLDLVFVEDVARANVLAAKSGVTNRVFNIGSGTETSLLDLAATLSRVMGSDGRVDHQDARKVNSVERRLADIARARDEIGFTTQVGLEEGLSRLVNWWRAQRTNAHV
jgi:UDP-glucose 4-epimerase